MKNEFWEKAFQEKKEMWGDLPSKSSEFVCNLFLSYNIKNVLIPGIGYGRNAKIFYDNGINVTGIEISKTAIKLANKYFTSNIKIYHGSVNDMPFDDIKYQGIYSYALLHLLDYNERNLFIKNCYNQLTENGVMVLTTISKDSSNYDQGKLIDKDRYEMHSGAKIYFYDKNSIEEDFKNYGLVDIINIEENFTFHSIICRK